MRGAGFTLIELLLTLAVIGIAAAVLTLSLRGGERRQLEAEAERLSALFRMAQSETRISGQSLLWEADLRGYRFRPAAVAPPNEELPEELLRQRTWPFEVRRLATRQVLFTREPVRVPAIVEIATPDHEIRLLLDALGNLRRTDCELRPCADLR
jgi:general secretion pathway protein H